MEKIDVLFIAVFIFGAAAFYAVICCIVLNKDIKNFIDLFNGQVKVNSIFKDFCEDQSAFNKCCVDNINKVDNAVSKIFKIVDNIDKKSDIHTSLTGGRRSEAEAQS